MITREEIDDAIFEIMREHGPDGHVDGHEIITKYICVLLERGEKINPSGAQVNS